MPTQIKFRNIYLASCKGRRIHLCQARQAVSEQLRALCNHVGSYYPHRENFRLTPEAKAKFTEKLGFDPNK